MWRLWLQHQQQATHRSINMEIVRLCDNTLTPVVHVITRIDHRSSQLSAIEIVVIAPINHTIIHVSRLYAIISGAHLRQQRPPSPKHQSVVVRAQQILQVIKFIIRDKMHGNDREKEIERDRESVCVRLCLCERMEDVVNRILKQKREKTIGTECNTVSNNKN